MTLAQAGSYQLELRFAAAESRPVELVVNELVIKSGAAAEVTGSWYPDTQRWSVEAIFTLKAGKNTLKLQRAGPFPHFDKLALIPQKLPDGATLLAPTTPEQLAIERKLNPIFLQQLADYLDKSPLPDGEVLTKLLKDPHGPFALRGTGSHNVLKTPGIIASTAVPPFVPTLFHLGTTARYPPWIGWQSWTPTAVPSLNKPWTLQGYTWRPFGVWKASAPDE